MRPDPDGTRPALRRTAAPLVVFAFLSAVYTWPLPLHLGTHFLHPTAPINPFMLADYYLTSWMLSWSAHQLLTDPLRLFEANIFYPCPHSLAFSEHMLAGALLVLPLDLVHHNPVLDHNVLAVASYVLGGAGMALLVRELGGSTAAGLVGGALFVFNPLRPGQIGHVQLLSVHWMPFTLLGLHRLLRSGRWLPGLGFAASLLLQALSSVYYTYYFGIAVAVFVGLHAACRCPAAPGAYRRTIGLGLGVAMALVPTFLPYLQAREIFSLARNPGQAFLFSALGETYLGVFTKPIAYLRSRYIEGALPTSIFGIGTFALVALGAALGAGPERGGRRATAAYLGMGILLALVSLGPSMRWHGVLGRALPGPHVLLARLLPGFDALRVPLRAAACAVFAFSVVAAFGADGLLARARGRAARLAAPVLVLAIVVADCWRPHLYASPVQWAGAPPPLYRWLAAQPGAFPIVELPAGSPPQDGLYMMASTYHWKRLVNGYSGFYPADSYLADVLFGFPNERSLRLLWDLGVRYVIVHPTMLLPGQRALCATAPARAAPYLAPRYQDAEACALEVLGAPAPPARAPDRRLSLATASLRSSTGDDARTVADGDLRTHWASPVSRTAPTWLEVELPETHALTRVVVRLGEHFGDYLRTYQVLTSANGSEWTPIVDQLIGEAPLPGLLTSPKDLRVEIALPPTATRFLRLLVPPRREHEPLFLYQDWGQWGVHELELYEASAAP